MKNKTKSTKEIIVDFINHCFASAANNQTIFLKNSTVPLKIPGFAIDKYGIYRSPDTYSRKFREAREENYFALNNLEITEVTDDPRFVNTPDKVFKISKKVVKKIIYEPIQENLFNG